jgi:glutamine amidotransferase
MTPRTDVALIDYGLGNLRSVAKMLASVGAKPTITADPDEIRKSDKIVLPGVGAFPQAKSNLETLNLIEVLEEEVVKRGKAYLGICLGMQLLATESYEGGRTEGFGWIPGRVQALAKGPGVRVPHMGWNDVAIKRKSDLFRDFHGRPTFYFTHTYNLVCDDDRDVLATTEYGGPFASAVQKGNIFGTQFHPEKSQTHGRILMENFCQWRG